MINKKKNLTLKSVWCKEGEIEKLKSLIISNYKDEVFNLLRKILIEREVN